MLVLEESELCEKLGDCLIWKGNSKFVLNVGPKPSETYTADHINREKTDNRVENLRWGTKSEQNYNRGF